jgi:8-oxo-dGTP diphosphatase
LIVFMKFNLAVKGIIRKKDKILVLRRSQIDDHKPGVWETPGGGMDEKSSPQKALKREIKEETNLKVVVKEPFHIFTFSKDTGEFKIGITFICEYVSGKVKLSPEHDDFKWINSKDFRKLKSLPSLYKEIDNYSKKYEK